MYSVTKQTLLEDVFPPQKLLYLCDAPVTDTAGAITDCMGTALASYPSASPNYMKEIALVWARYHAAAFTPDPPDPADPADPADPPDPDPTYGVLRLRYAAKIFGSLPSVVAPPAPLHHCRALVRLLSRMAAMTSFSRTGDLMVHKLIMTMVEPQRAAELSVNDTPFNLAGEHFGAEANRVVRGLFEKNIDADFKDKQWEVSCKVSDAIFFLSIMFEAGEDLGTRICCNHEAAFIKNREGISFFCWENRVGFIAHRRVVFADPEFVYPIPSMVLSGLEMLAISGSDGAAAAESLLCAVKTPEKAGVNRPPHPCSPCRPDPMPAATDERPRVALPPGPQQPRRSERRSLKRAAAGTGRGRGG